MGNAISNLSKQNINLNTDVKENIEQKVKEMKFKPSESLILIWKSLNPGIVYWDIELSKPFQIIKLEMDENLQNYQGIDKWVDSDLIMIGKLWADTDSVTSVYEICSGEHSGELLCLSYDSIKIFHSTQTTKDLITVFETLSFETPEECSGIVFNRIFRNKKQD